MRSSASGNADVPSECAAAAGVVGGRQPDRDEPDTHASITWRAIVLGALLAGLINFACPYGVLVLHNAGLTSDYITAGAMMLLFVLAGAVNPLLKVFWPGASLGSRDLIIVYVMMIVASAIPTWGLVTNLFHILTRPFYYATPENNWVDMLQPLLPAWLAPRDPAVARFFYEGLPLGTQGIPWRSWAMPLLAWGSFMLAVFLWMVSTMIILRRPWVERERLTFPLTQLPLEMIRGSDDHLVPPLFRNAMMWVGFSLPFIIQMTRGLHHYHFFVPELTTLFEPVTLFRNSVRLIIFVNFAIIGLVYFLSLPVSFSVWFFHLLSRTQTGIFNVIGFEIKGHNESLTGSSIASSHQGMGAMLALVVAMLWTSRDHLRRVARAAIRRGGDGADGDEILSYRATSWLWIGCLAYITIWLLATGLPPLATVVFLLGAFVIFLAIARVIAQGGVGFTSSPMLPQAFTVYALGTDLIGWKGLASTGLSYSWAAEMRTTVMASTANGLKLISGGNLRSHRAFWAIVLAIVVGLVVATWTTLHLNYTYGGINLRQFGVPTTAWRFVEDKLLNPVGWEYIRPRLLFTVVGAALMGGLVWLQHHVLWWPLHFIGLPVADSWVMGWAWFSVLIGWLLKAIILRIGGTPAVRTYKPIFVGFIAGQLMGGAVWMIVDIVLGETGNRVYIGVP